MALLRVSTRTGRCSFAPPGLRNLSLATHGLRRGLHSCAAPRLTKLVFAPVYLFVHSPEDLLSKICVARAEQTLGRRLSDTHVSKTTRHGAPMEWRSQQKNISQPGAAACDNVPTRAKIGLEWGTEPTSLAFAALAGTNAASYSACMRTIGPPVLLLCLIVLAFCGVVYTGCRSWRKMSAGKRIGGVLLLSPHFLLIVCMVVLLVCGHAPQGSRCFNDQFASGVLALFILPLPTLVGTSVALSMFRRARRGLQL
jgi:hypothetical protein